MLPNPSSFHCHPLSLDTGSLIDDFVKKETELGTGTVTATDHGSMASAYLVYTKAKKAGLTPILGLEAYVREDKPGGILERFGVTPNTDPDSKYFGTTYEYLKYLHCTLHYIDQAAYEVGCRILSDAPREKHGEAKPIYSLENIEELGSMNITGGSGCLIGVVQRHLLAGRPDIARAYYEWYRSCFKKGNFFVEVFPHQCTHNWVAGVFVTVDLPDGSPKTYKFYSEKKLRTNEASEIEAEMLAYKFNTKDTKHTHLTGIKNYRTWEDVEFKLTKVEKIERFVENECQVCTDGTKTTDVQLIGNKFMLELAREFGDPVLVSDDSHLATPDHKIVQDVALAQSGNWRFHNSYHRQSGEESYRHFQATLGTSLKEFESWVDNSRQWASKFKDFKFNYQPTLATKFYPENTLEHFQNLIAKHGRVNPDPVYQERLETEINMLHRNGKIDLLPYFFPAEEICEQYAINGELAGLGRGSAAGLLAAYYLGITHVDPIKTGLSMERFITMDRILSGKLPDIDQDLSSTDFLVGTTVDRHTVEMEDGSTRVYLSSDLVLTDEGMLPIEEAIDRGLDILDEEEDEDETSDLDGVSAQVPV